MKKAIRLLFVFFLMSSIDPIFAQCPLCKTTVKSNNNEQKAVGMGLNNGILFLMAFPYIIAGTAGVIWYNKNKKNKRKN